jgi:predicted amidophosphoribosyltransferase
MLFAVMVKRGDQTHPCVLAGFGAVLCAFCGRQFHLSVEHGDKCPGCGAEVTSVDRRGKEMGVEV